MRRFVGPALAVMLLLSGPAGSRAENELRTGRQLFASVEPSDQRERSREPVIYLRHRQAALILSGLVLALLVLIGYLRLVEATRGYYSGRLLGAATVLVGVVVLLIWWWM